MLSARVSLLGCLFGGLVLLASSVVRADFVQFAPVADARIIESIYSPASINTNYGSDFLALYHGRGNEQRTLLGFDLAGRPAGSILHWAILTLTASTRWGDNGANVPMEIYRVTQPWNEHSVSWNYRDETDVWSRAGATYAGLPGVNFLAPYASNSTNVGEGGTVSFDITHLVEEWTTGIQPNYGLVITSGLANGLTFDSTEQSPTSRAPVAPALIINYSVLSDLDPPNAEFSGSISSILGDLTPPGPDDRQFTGSLIYTLDGTAVLTNLHYQLLESIAGQSSSTGTGVPESSTLLLGTLGSALFLFVRRHRCYRTASSPDRAN